MSDSQTTIASLGETPATKLPNSGDNPSSSVSTLGLSFDMMLRSNNQTPIFTLFPKLPPELRKIIWTFSTYSERVVEMDSKHCFNSKTKRTEHRFFSKTLVPVLLHVNLESRTIGLTIYQELTFAGNVTGTYIDWSHDFVHFIEHDRREEPSWTCGSNLKLFLSTTTRYKGQRMVNELKEKCQKLITFGVGDAVYAERKGMQNLRSLVTLLGAGSGPGDMTLIEISEVDLAGYCDQYLDDYRKTWTHLITHQAKVESIAEVMVSNGIRKEFLGKSQDDKAREKKEITELFESKGVTIPQQAPKRASFKNDKLRSLQMKAVNRGLSREGTRKELIAELEIDEDFKRGAKTKQYNEDLKAYWAVLNEHRDAKYQAKKGNELASPWQGLAIGATKKPAKYSNGKAPPEM